MGKKEKNIRDRGKKKGVENGLILSPYKQGGDFL